MQPEDRNWFHLRQIVRMVALIENRLMTFDKPAFLADRNEIDLTSFRLQVIGEAVRKVNDTIKERYPEVAWSQIVAMRNFIAHDYEGIDIERVWSVAKNSLRELESVCRAELGTEGLVDL